MKERKIQPFTVTVNSATEIGSANPELDRNYTNLVGIGVSQNINMPKGLILSASLAGTEVLADNFEVGMIKASENVAPNERYLSLNPMPSAGKKFELKFQENGTAGPYPKTVTFYLVLEK